MGSCPVSAEKQSFRAELYGLSWSEFTEHFIENTQEETDGMTQTVRDRMMNSTHKLCTIKQNHMVIHN